MCTQKTQNKTLSYKLFFALLARKRKPAPQRREVVRLRKSIFRWLFFRLQSGSRQSDIALMLGLMYLTTSFGRHFCSEMTLVFMIFSQPTSLLKKSHGAREHFEDRWN
jgi:hypothetical protein